MAPATTINSPLRILIIDEMDARLRNSATEPNSVCSSSYLGMLDLMLQPWILANQLANENVLKIDTVFSTWLKYTQSTGAWGDPIHQSERRIEIVSTNDRRPRRLTRPLYAHAPSFGSSVSISTHSSTPSHPRSCVQLSSSRPFDVLVLKPCDTMNMVRHSKC